MKTVRIAAAQTPEFRDDVAAALQHLNAVSTSAEAQDVSLLAFPEAYLQGYILEEHAARRVAFDLNAPGFAALLRAFPKTGPMIVVGLIETHAGKLFNTAILVKERVLVGLYRKTHPLGAEQAFTPGKECPIFEVDGLRFGINICFDTNFSDIARKIADTQVTLIVCCANNMLPMGKAELFRQVHNAVRAERCRETGLWLISSDVTGERDGLVSWGPSAVLGPGGDVAVELPLGQPGLLTFDMPVG